MSKYKNMSLDELIKEVDNSDNELAKALLYHYRQHIAEQNDPLITDFVKSVDLKDLARYNCGNG